MPAYRAARPIQVGGVSFAVGDVVTGSDSWPNAQRWVRLRFLKAPTPPSSFTAARAFSVGASSFTVGQTVPGAAGWPNLHRWVQFGWLTEVP